MHIHELCTGFYSTSGAFDLYGCSGTRRNSQCWFQNQITFLWAIIKGGRGNSKIYLINENDMDTMYSQYAEAQKIQLWCDGRSVLVYIAQ